jgi:DNA repair exonuclease SbcCD nuclease subunit
MKILCTGDLHLGRRSSRLPDGIDARAHSATAAWHSLVQLAIDERVGLVALSGDVVDRDNGYFEAVGALERGVARLREAGIPVVAVAGNHDCRVLPKIAPSLGRNFQLIGAGGRWQALTFQREGKPALRLVGWSFPTDHVAASPLAGFPALPDDGVPALGLLHTDLDQPGSPYAPASAGELRAKGVSFWLLGHLHTPRIHEHAGGAPLLYPGSLQALDPGETGAHGAWMVELAPGRAPSARLVPLSTVRYDAVEVDVSGVADGDELDVRVAEGVRSHVQRVVEQGCGPLRQVMCRVRLAGRTPLHRGIDVRLRPRLPQLDAQHGEVQGRVERLEVATRPAVELDELARGADAPGVLARFVRALDGGPLDGAHERLLAELAARTAEVRRARPYQLIGEDPPRTPAELRELARRQALLLLDELLAQKEAA